MNINTLRQRLERLEATNASVPTPSKPDPLLSVMQGWIAHHLGNAGPSESIAEAMARGLGYEKGGDLVGGLRAGAETPRRDDLNARWRGAINRLFALKDAVPDCDGPTFGATVEALFSEMPERLQRHPFLAGNAAIYEEAA